MWQPQGGGGAVAPTQGSCGQGVLNWIFPCCLARNGSRLTTPPSGRSADLSAVPRRRTSLHATFRLRCAQKYSSPCPVQLVVFDFDETLTLATFMGNVGASGPEREAAKVLNFESPWVDGSRIQKLKNLLRKLAKSQTGRRRPLAVLTKNSNANGVMGVLRELEAADLDQHFDAIWIMPPREGQRGGVYRGEAGRWKPFDPPMRKAPHKAVVLQDIAASAHKWFPQIQRGWSWKKSDLWLQDLKPESIVLVDDQRSNFLSPCGVQVARYCKVARYDADYRHMGFLKDMGGIGAHSDADYEAMLRFVDDPGLCHESFACKCAQMQEVVAANTRPVRLVVFDFDETLTMATFMPSDEACAQAIGWTPKQSHDDHEEWTEQELVDYNFESPFVGGSRVEKLRSLLVDLAEAPELGVAQAILTRNASGVVAVLNLLKMAKLEAPFSAIWGLASCNGAPSGVYQDASGVWRPFEPPLARTHHHPADVLGDVAAHPEQWLPQMRVGGTTRALQQLQGLQLEGIVLVDDERTNFKSTGQSRTEVLRYCKVARYDEVYRECGSMTQMGGLGAHCDEDYDFLKAFVRRPWDFPYEPSPGAVQAAVAGHSGAHASPQGCQRIATSEVDKTPRRKPLHVGGA